MPESGRAVIREQVASGGNALPWADRAAFAEAMLTRDIAAWHGAQAHDGPVVFDRGIPDVMGYLLLCGLAVPPHIHTAARSFRYHGRVLIAPPWQDIFVQDTERKQDFAEAVATHDVMHSVYSDLGYELVAVPQTDVAARVAFVREAFRGA